LIFNTQKYPLSLVEVRRAIAYALDRAEMSIAVSPHPDMAMWPDYPTGMLVGDEYIWIDNDYLEEYFDKYEYNLDRAIEIFESLNFVKGADGIWVTPNGTRLEFDLISAPWTDWALSCENTKLQLAKAGILINVYATEPVTCVQVPAGDFDLAYFCMLRRWLPLPTETFQQGFVIRVNATDWARKLPTVFDEEEQKEIITALAYIANHYLPYYAMREKPCTYTYNVYDVVFPPEGDAWYKWAAYSLYDALGYYVLNGWIYPTPPEVIEEEVLVEVVPSWVYAVAGVAVIAVVAAAIVVMTKRT
jgi:peptide/nickel transport system substrate-binding protein